MEIYFHYIFVFVSRFVGIIRQMTFRASILFNSEYPYSRITNNSILSPEVKFRFCHLRMTALHSLYSNKYGNLSCSKIRKMPSIQNLFKRAT